MRVVRQRGPRTPLDTPAAVGLGLFDGVHIGHAAVIGAARQAAAEGGLRLAVFTFPGGAAPKGAKLVLTEPQKERQLAALGVDTCYQPSFDSFKSLPPEGFFGEMLLGQYNAKALACGDDFSFGAHRAGNATLLKTLCDQNGVALRLAPTALYKGQPVSSSRIRAALAEGELEDVNAMLGRPYELDAEVGHGKKLGSKLGFPTINQTFPKELQPPAYGVYATKTRVGPCALPSVTGWGTRPTVDGGPPTCETFIPNFDGDLYDEDIAVQFYTRLDGVHKFASFDELAAAVQGWAQQALAYFRG